LYRLERGWRTQGDASRTPSRARPRLAIHLFGYYLWACGMCVGLIPSFELDFDLTLCVGINVCKTRWPCERRHTHHPRRLNTLLLLLQRSVRTHTRFKSRSAFLFIIYLFFKSAMFYLIEDAFCFYSERSSVLPWIWLTRRLGWIDPLDQLTVSNSKTWITFEWWCLPGKRSASPGSSMCPGHGGTNDSPSPSPSPLAPWRPKLANEPKKLNFPL
jgi:hypothetical protein